MLKTLEISFFILGVCMVSNAQEAIATSGGDISGAGGSVSCTVGQVAWSNFSTHSGTINQGIQQTYEITVMPTGEDMHAISPELSVYPNPATDLLILKVKDYSPGNLYYYLFDTNGKLIESRSLDGIDTIIHMEKLARSVYFLQVIIKDNEVRTFKIVKN